MLEHQRFCFSYKTCSKLVCSRNKIEWIKRNKGWRLIKSLFLVIQWEKLLRNGPLCCIRALQYCQKMLRALVGYFQSCLLNITNEKSLCCFSWERAPSPVCDLAILSQGVLSFRYPSGETTTKASICLLPRGERTHFSSWPFFFFSFKETYWIKVLQEDLL